MFISSNDFMHFAWYTNKTVSAGSSDDLANNRPPYAFTLSPGMLLSDLLSISCNDDMHFAWYLNGTVSAGSSDNLGNKRAPYLFTLAKGKQISDLIAISSNDSMHFAWYKDSTVSAGSSENLANKRAPSPFKLAPGKTISDVIKISSNDSMHFAWYSDNTVSAGSIDDLGNKRAPYPFTWAADHYLASQPKKAPAIVTLSNPTLGKELASRNLHAPAGLGLCSDIVRYPVDWLPYLGDWKNAVLNGGPYFRYHTPSEIEGVGVLTGVYDGKLIGNQLMSNTCELLVPYPKSAGHYSWVLAGNDEVNIVYKWNPRLDLDSRQYTRHSQLNAGEPVICAGEFTIEPPLTPRSRFPLLRELHIELNDSSGHYKPDGGKCFSYVRDKFHELGVNVSNTAWFSRNQ